MTKPAQEGESLDAKMSAKELASYEWKGMGNDKSRALFEGSEPIKVTVGAERKRKTWYLPKKVLTHCSPFFDAALNGNFVEASAKAVDLPEDDPKAFEVWATWLSLGKCNDSLDNDDDFDFTHVRAWVLGEKFACPAFKDHVMSHFLDWLKARNQISLSTIEVAYEASSPGSKLRWLSVDWVVWFKLNWCLVADTDKLIAFLRELPGFSDDVVRREVILGREAIEFSWKDKHHYYENPAFKPDA